MRTTKAFDSTLILFLSDNGASAEIMVRDDGHDPAAAPGSAATYMCLGPGWSSTSNTPFRRHKTWVHEGGIATPLIVHWPDRITTPGELRHNLGHVIDLVPTILEAAGGTALKIWNDRPVPPAPGKSLLSVFAEDGSVCYEDLCLPAASAIPLNLLPLSGRRWPPASPAPFCHTTAGPPTGGAPWIHRR